MEAMHFLREALHLGTSGWQKRREELGFFKRKYRREVKNWEVTIQLSHKVRKQMNARVSFSYCFRYLCKGHYSESYPA